MYTLNLDNEDNGDIIRRRTIRRRCSLFYAEQELHNFDDYDNACNQDAFAFGGTITDPSDDSLDPFDNLGEAGTYIRLPMNKHTPKLENIDTVKRRPIRRRCSLFYAEEELLDVEDFNNIWNQDAFAGTMNDLSDDNLYPFGNSDEDFAVKDRTLSLTMNFDINRYSYVGDRRASIAIAKLTSEELDTRTPNIAQPITFHPTTENLSESHTREQLSTAPLSIDPLSCFSGNLAGYYSTLRNNLLEATEKSKVTRVALMKMSGKLITKRTILQTKYVKREVIMTSERSKHLRRRSMVTRVVIAQPDISYPTENLFESHMVKQLSPTLPSVDPPPFFSGNLVGYYSMLQNNLFKANEKSKETRVCIIKIREYNLSKAMDRSKVTRLVLAKVKENVIKKRAARQMKRTKRKVIKKPKPSKHLCKKYE